MDADDSGPSSIRSLAVTAEDVVAAVEARYQRDEPVVLRATPPYSARMRARLHVEMPADESAPDAVHVDPTKLLTDAAPAYPRPTDTEDALRDDPTETYTVERHHDRHRRALADWRDAICSHITDEVVIETDAGDRTVDVVVLG